MMLSELAKRCEQASGSDRGLDGRIAYALGWRFNGLSAGVDDPDFDEWEHVAGHWAQPGSDFCPVDRPFSSEIYPDPPQWTACVDAAATLVPDGFVWSLDGGYRRAMNSAQIGREPTGGELMQPLAEGEGETAALALCAAALRIRSAGTTPESRT